MKKLGLLLLTFSLLFSLLPQTVMAAQSETFTQDYQNYLSEVSTIRGFEVSETDIDLILAYSAMNIEDFNTIEELSIFLGEVINSDLSNLSALYELNSLDETSLNQLLSEYGESISDYIFLTDLSLVVDFYLGDVAIEKDPDFDQVFQDYLESISQIRGFQVTKEMVETSLAKYETSLDDFATVDILKDFLGDVISSDLNNLVYFNDTYGLDQEALFQLLDENDKTINDYVYIDDVENYILTNYNGAIPGFDEAYLTEILPIIFEKLGLTEVEINNLENHFLSLEEKFSAPESLDQLTAITDRLMAFLEVPPVGDELTDAQITELTSILQDILSFSNLNVSFQIIENGVERSLSLADLYRITDLGDNTLKVSLYNSVDSSLLADFIVSNDILESINELFQESVDEIESVVNDVIDSNSNKQVKASNQTVKGGKLPKTASNYVQNILIGLFIAIVGLLVYRKLKNNEGDCHKNQA
jgi:processed acidic surface protein